MENYVGTILTYAIKKRFENEKLSSGIEKEKENIPSHTQHGLHNAKRIIKVPIQMFLPLSYGEHKCCFGLGY